ncbi:MAG: hypothetical protein HC923_09270, partial [Myxococcales bacterium]|nr:hypothetical protein [Myxococcales bacterium]
MSDELSRETRVPLKADRVAVEQSVAPRKTEELVKLELDRDRWKIEDNRGRGDQIEAQTRLNEFDQLEVEQRIINNTDRELSFRCSLYVPGRRRTSVDLEHISQGQDSRTYVVPNGNSLIGQQL